MIELERLKSIVTKLTSEERRLIRKGLVNYFNNGDLFSNTIKLYDLLNIPGGITNDTISKSISISRNKIALKKNLQRLTDKILDILISRPLINDEIYDSVSMEVFKVKRKLLYYDSLAAHGITGYALTILNQAIKMSKKIEYYDYLIIALNKKLIKMSLRSGKKKYLDIYNEIKYYSDCNFSLKRSQYLIRLYSSNYDYKQKIFSNEELLSSIKEINNDFIRTKSKNIKINLFYLEGIYYYINNNYNKCKSIFLKLLFYLRDNKNVIFNSYFETCYLNISECETQLFNFEKSLSFLNKIVIKQIRNEFNTKLILEMYFLNNYYSGNIDSAVENINEILELSSSDGRSPFLAAKIRFYQAVLFALVNDFKEANNILTHCNFLDKDKDGWNLGFRLLLIINNIELNRLLYAESLIENLRKHISRIKIESRFTIRIEIISKIFSQLVINSFKFDIVYEKNAKEFNKLKSVNTDFSWRLKSPEMIIFHEWFEAKVKGMPYNHAEVMKRMRKQYKPPQK